MACLAFPFELLMALVGVWTYFARRLAPRQRGFSGPVYSVRGVWAQRAGLVMTVPFFFGMLCGIAEGIRFVTVPELEWISIALLVAQGVVVFCCGMTVNWLWLKHHTPEGDVPPEESSPR